jgi:hypothetical protein
MEPGEEEGFGGGEMKAVKAMAKRVTKVVQSLKSWHRPTDEAA